jgi:hypothetical protein
VCRFWLWATQCQTGPRDCDSLPGEHNCSPEPARRAAASHTYLPRTTHRRTACPLAAAPAPRPICSSEPPPLSQPRDPPWSERAHRPSAIDPARHRSKHRAQTILGQGSVEMGNTPSRRQQQQQPLPPGYQAAPVFPGGPQVRLRWRGVTIPARCRPGSQPEPTAALAVHQRPVLRGLHRRAVWPVPGAVPRPAGAGERHARCEHRPPPSRRPQPTSPRAQAPPIPQQFGGPRPVPTQEYQKTATVKNPVNLKKHTISLTPLPDQPHILSVSFTFDADEPCRSAQVAESCPLAAPRAGRGGGLSFPWFQPFTLQLPRPLGPSPPHWPWCAHAACHPAAACPPAFACSKPLETARNRSKSAGSARL